jgi:trans-aconitate methyltransferase
MSETQTLEKVTVELVKAHADDLKELDHYIDLGNGQFKKKMKLRHGIPYWLKSIATGLFDPNIYRLDERTDTEMLAGYLENDMIYIAKYHAQK